MTFYDHSWIYHTLINCYTSSFAKIQGNKIYTPVSNHIIRITVKYISTLDAGPYTILFTYNVRMHLNMRIIDLSLFLKDYSIAITEGETVGRDLRNGKSHSLWKCMISKL